MDQWNSNVAQIGTENGGTGAARALAFITASTTRMTIDTTGNVGIGTTSPWRTLSVAGTVGFNSSLTQSSTGDYLCINTASFEVSRGNGVACSTSSQRFKDNIQSISYGLSAVVNLHPVSFTYKPEMNVSTSTRLGFIAEEMALTIPELVNRDAQGLPSGIDYPTPSPSAASSPISSSTPLEPMVATSSSATTTTP